MKRLLTLILFALILCCAGCQNQQTEEPQKVTPTPQAETATPPAAEPAPQANQADQTTAAKPEAQPEPPTPPILEDFEGDPKLSLFPRVGDFRPAAGSDQLPVWGTFIDHLLRTSGVLASKEEPPQHVFAFRSINGIDSVAFFSPLAVTPDTNYTVSCSIRTDRGDLDRTGLGIIEFDQFLWVGDQFSRAEQEQHQTGSIQGPVVTGQPDWQPVSFDFRTGPKTRMIHLILYREGSTSRSPSLFDNISIEPAATGTAKDKQG